MRLFYKVLLLITIAAQLNACAPAIIGGAAVGGSIAADRRTSGIYIEDENIELKSSSQLTKALGENAHVNVTSYNRNVLLTGQVAKESQKVTAEDLIKQVENVRTVYNEINIKAVATIGTRTNDTYLTSKVKTKFIGDDRFDANVVKVVTEENVVFLMGLVTRAEGAAAADVASKTGGINKVIKLFEYID